MLSIKEQERIKCQFAAFCKVVLRNAVCSYLRDLGRKRKRETSLDYIIEQKYCEPHCTDEYFIKLDIPTDFIVQGQIVTVDDKRLAKALFFLSEQQREIILLYYFLHYKDYQLAALLECPRSTVQYQRQAALNQLRKEMERTKDEI